MLEAPAADADRRLVEQAAADMDARFVVNEEEVRLLAEDLPEEPGDADWQSFRD